MNELDEILKLANCAPEAEELLEVADSFDIELSEDFVIETGIVGFVEDGVVITGDEKTLQLLEEYGFQTEETTHEIVEAHNLSMHDLMSQLDQIAARSSRDIPSRSSVIHDKKDWMEKRKELQRLMMGRPDPETRRQVIIQLAALDDAAKEQGFELAEDEMNEMMLMGVSNEPSESVQMEAEYQGRKVQLNKPMAGDVAKSKVYVKKPNGKVVKVNFGDKNMRIKKSNPARRKSFRARHHCDNPGPKWKARYWSCRAW